MDYWISSKGNRAGPYSLEQLQVMWEQGHLTSDTFYYESLRAEWLPLKALIEKKQELFTVEEAFVRLGQNRQSGCLLVYNKEECLELFTDAGFIIHAIGQNEVGEFALSRALRLENSSYEWFHEVKPPAATLRINVHEYALKHSIARDVRVNSPAKRKHNTVAIPNILSKTEVKLKFNYLLVPEATPFNPIRVDKMTSVVGRDDHCDLVIESPSISRRHCLLEATDEYVKVKDLDSSNGTFINGLPVKDGFLSAKDQLSLGGFLLTLQKEQKRAPEFNG